MSESTQAQLEEEFHEDMWQIIEMQKANFPHWPFPSRFAQMLEKYGGVEMAHRLLKNNDHPPTFAILRKLKRTDLCAEHYVMLDRYKSLFKPEDREIAEFRLDRGE